MKLMWSSVIPLWSYSEGKMTNFRVCYISSQIWHINATIVSQLFSTVWYDNVQIKSCVWITRFSYFGRFMVTVLLENLIHNNKCSCLLMYRLFTLYESCSTPKIVRCIKRHKLCVFSINAMFIATVSHNQLLGMISLFYSLL